MMNMLILIIYYDEYADMIIYYDGYADMIIYYDEYAEFDYNL